MKHPPLSWGTHDLSASGISRKAKDKFVREEGGSCDKIARLVKLAVDVEREENEAEKRVDLSYRFDSTARGTFNPVRA